MLQATQRLSEFQKGLMSPTDLSLTSIEHVKEEANNKNEEYYDEEYDQEDDI